jgi:hypothetical protein
MSNVIERFVRRLKRIGIDVQLSANAPWVYLDSVNNQVLMGELFMANHGFTAFWLPVHEGRDIVFTDRRKVIAKVREYAKRKKALQDMTTWQEENGLYEEKNT